MFGDYHCWYFKSITVINLVISMMMMMIIIIIIIITISIIVNIVDIVGVSAMYPKP